MTRSNVGNAILFQIVWFACVMASDRLALVSVCLLLLIHHLYMMKDRREWALILGFTSCGIVIDSTLQSLGVIDFSNAIIINEDVSLVPVWMMCLWLAFSTTLVHGLFWLHGRFVFATLVGLLAVPLSYYGGIVLSGSHGLTPLWWTLAVIGGVWAIMLPTVLWMAQRYGLIGGWPLNVDQSIGGQ
jgi:hypothetical protein